MPAVRVRPVNAEDRGRRRRVTPASGTAAVRPKRRNDSLDQDDLDTRRLELERNQLAVPAQVRRLAIQIEYPQCTVSHIEGTAGAEENAAPEGGGILVRLGES